MGASLFSLHVVVVRPTVPFAPPWGQVYYTTADMALHEKYPRQDLNLRPHRS